MTEQQFVKRNNYLTLICMIIIAILLSSCVKSDEKGRVVLKDTEPDSTMKPMLLYTSTTGEKIYAMEVESVRGYHLGRVVFSENEYGEVTNLAIR